MKRLITATGLAALFAVGLAAQSTTGTAGSTPQDPQTTTAGGGQGRGGPRTLTGCLRAGDTEGTYMLTNVEGLGGRMGGGAAGAGAATTTGGAGTTTAGAAATTGSGQGRAMAGGIMLNADSSVDLKAHVGHKIEVTGTFAGGGRRGGDATGATGATTTGGGTTTGTASGTTAAGAGQTAGTTGAQGGGRAMRSMTVTSVKMVSDSCS